MYYIIISVCIYACPKNLSVTIQKLPAFSGLPRWYTILQR